MNQRAFPRSAGLTDEASIGMLCFGEEGTPHVQNIEAQESIEKQVLVQPLATFTNKERFQQWVHEMEQAGYIVDSDIPMFVSMLSSDLEEQLLIRHMQSQRNRIENLPQHQSGPSKPISS